MPRSGQLMQVSFHEDLADERAYFAHVPQGNFRMKPRRDLPGGPSTDTSKAG